ncbi:hypothetical protein ABZ599_16595 [Streptomyces misionensis]|uniref:hypothetical protein n=1 Tax=Streptomyces misionensis TaxID=67331 RepID=UPI0033D2C261
MPRNQSRAGQRARATQKATGTKAKYTELLRAKLGPRGARREPVHAEPARRLAAELRAGFGAEGEKAALLVDAAVAWAVKDHELKHALLCAQGDLAARTRLQPAVDEHAVGEVTVHDAPLVQVVHMVLEMAAEDEESASADLLRAAADVLDRLVGASHICSPAIYGLRAGGWLTEPRMWERIYTTTAPVAVVAAAALRTMREAACILDEDELADADCMLTLQEAVRFARTAADLAICPAV